MYFRCRLSCASSHHVREAILASRRFAVPILPVDVGRTYLILDGLRCDLVCSLVGGVNHFRATKIRADLCGFYDVAFGLYDFHRVARQH